MPIQTTLGALIAAEPALTRVIARDWPLSMAFKLARLARVVRVETATFEALRQQLVKKYGTEPDADGNFHVKPQHLSEFARQVNEAAAAAVALDAQPLSASQIAKHAPEMRVSPQDLADLGPLFLDDEEAVT